jgi:hypothetical protein
MTCTKTGCHVYLECYDEFLYGDAYETGNIACFRIAGRSKDPFQKRIHYRVKDFNHWFDAETNTSLLITEEFIRYSYEGELLYYDDQGKLKI